jgi:hypothetical protein
VALEATTGWRFLVEELRAVGAVVHLAEPAETAALRGNKRRAKSDRADARQNSIKVLTATTLWENRPARAGWGSARRPAPELKSNSSSSCMRLAQGLLNRAEAHGTASLILGRI